MINLHAIALWVLICGYYVCKIESLVINSRIYVRNGKKTACVSKIKTARPALPDSDLLGAVDDDENQVFSQRQRLKEETEAPLRNLRIFFYVSLIGKVAQYKPPFDRLASVFCLYSTPLHSLF